VAEIPDQIVLRRHRDLEGRRRGIVWRRVAVGVLCAFLLAGLLNVFGQRPSDIVVSSPAATLDFHAPSHLRGGLLYEASFTIRAHRKLDHPTIVLSPGWAITEQINSLEPSPADETSNDGALALTLNPIAAGSTYTLFGEFQVNPTSVGSWPGDVSLFDGSKRLVHIDREIVVFP
jgi:hypothetical protein